MLIKERAFTSACFCFAVMFAPYLSSCSSTQEQAKDSSTVAAAAPSKLSPEEQKKVDDAAAEMEVGRNMAGRLIKFYGAYPDEKLVRYVNEVGALVGRYSDFPERRYMFEVYYSDEVNAFACPGGYILVSLGALKNASNEAELAHVLGHEIAHVGKKHMFNALAKMSADELKKTGDQATKFNDLPEEMKARKRPDPEESAVGSLVARYLTGNSAGLNIIQAARAGMSLITEKGLGANLEYEADREGTRYAINAGYNSRALINFLCRIETARGHNANYCMQKPKDTEKAVSTLDKTHPPIPDRILNIKEVLKAMKANAIVGAKGRKRYLAIKERIKGVTAEQEQENDKNDSAPDLGKD
ncbi:MAG: M48 family metalloprotease [Chitinophagaceae bacterium]|nr:M48 family metalloprotease [Oligoflexus sp.]